MVVVKTLDILSFSMVAKAIIGKNSQITDKIVDTNEVTSFSGQRASNRTQFKNKAPQRLKIVLIHATLKEFIITSKRDIPAVARMINIFDFFRLSKTRRIPRCKGSNQQRILKMKEKNTIISSSHILKKNRRKTGLYIVCSKKSFLRLLMRPHSFYFRYLIKIYNASFLGISKLIMRQLCIKIFKCLPCFKRSVFQYHQPLAVDGLNINEFIYMYNLCAVLIFNQQYLRAVL